MDERGFSLLDALIAAAILVTGVGALVQLLVIASQSATVAAQTTGAATLAAQKAEELRAVPWDEVTGGDDRSGEYARRWSVAPFTTGGADALIIQVAVSPGGAHLVTLRRRVSP